MLAPTYYQHKEIVAMNRAYVNYEKFEELTDRNVVYVTKKKKSLRYETQVDCMEMNTEGKMEYREQVVVFRKGTVNHIARIITYVDMKKDRQAKLVSLLTNDFDMPLETVVAIYRRRWQIESLFKQIKQNFPLRYFYGESANAIKTRIWITLIANLLITLVKNKIKRFWSFSGLATMIRILLMSYVSIQRFFEQPHKDWDRLITQVKAPPEELSLF